MATLNFTGRQEIDRSRVQVRVREADGKVLLDVMDLNLAGLDLPDSAAVAVEAYRQTVKVRVPCGSVNVLERPQDVHLSAFDIADNIQLRVRVIGSGGASHGKVLAVADHLRGVAHEDQDSEPLLKLQRAELGDLVWKFGIDGDRPVLYVNKYLQNHDGLINSEQFKALVLPEFLRQVALWIARNIDDAQDPHSTMSHWLTYLASIDVDLSELDEIMELGADDPSSSDVIDLWAAGAASAFASRIGSLALLNERYTFREDGE